MRGLGILQINQREKTIIKILNTINSNNIITYSQLLQKSGISDKITLRKHLIHLLNSKKIGSKKLTCIPGLRSGIYYYKNPAQKHVRDLIMEEDYFQHTKNPKKYSFGTLLKIPLHIQFIHKRRILELHLKQHPAKLLKPKNYQLPFSEFTVLNTTNPIFIMNKIQKDLKKMDDPFCEIALEMLDKLALRCGLKPYMLTNNLSQLETLYVITLLTIFSIRYIAKKFHCTTAPIKKIKKSFFVDDVHVDPDKVTKLHNFVYGEKMYLIRTTRSLSSKSNLSKPYSKKRSTLRYLDSKDEYVPYGEYFNWLRDQA